VTVRKNKIKTKGCK